jgi:hypothetical protein
VKAWRETPMKFTLEIELGNDAMQTYADVELATRLIFKHFSQRDEEPENGDTGRLYDINGNKVGSWLFEG